MKLLDLRSYRNGLQAQLERLQRTVAAVDVLIAEISGEPAQKAAKETKTNGVVKRKYTRRGFKHVPPETNGASETARAPVAPVAPRADGELSTSDKVRRACASCGEPFAACDVRGAMERLFNADQRQLVQVGALLSQFAARGELKREGTGASAQYRVLALKG